MPTHPAGTPQLACPVPACSMLTGAVSLLLQPQVPSAQVMDFLFEKWRLYGEQCQQNLSLLPPPTREPPTPGRETRVPAHVPTARALQAPELAGSGRCGCCPLPGWDTPRSAWPLGHWVQGSGRKGGGGWPGHRVKAGSQHRAEPRLGCLWAGWWVLWCQPLRGAAAPGLGTSPLPCLPLSLQSWSVTEHLTSTPAGLTPCPIPQPASPAPGTCPGTTKVIAWRLGWGTKEDMGGRVG